MESGRWECDGLGSSEHFVCQRIMFCWCGWVTGGLGTAIPGGDAELRLERWHLDLQGTEQERTLLSQQSLRGAVRSFFC